MKETKEMYPSWGDDYGVRLENVKISDLHDFKESWIYESSSCEFFKKVRKFRVYQKGRK